MTTDGRGAWRELRGGECTLCGSGELEIRRPRGAGVHVIRCGCGCEIQHEDRARLLEAVGIEGKEQQWQE